MSRHSFSGHRNTGGFLLLATCTRRLIASCHWRIVAFGCEVQVRELAFTLRPPRCTAVDRNPTGVMSLSRPEANRRLPRQIIDLAATATGRGFGVLSLSNVSAQLQRTPEHGRFPPARHLHQETHRKLSIDWCFRVGLFR